MKLSVWPYWLRGSTVTFILYIPTLAITLLGNDAGFFLWPLTIPMWPIIWIIGLPHTYLGLNSEISVLSQQIIVFIAAVLIGAGLGYLWGKIWGVAKT